MRAILRGKRPYRFILVENTYVKSNELIKNNILKKRGTTQSNIGLNLWGYMLVIYYNVN